MLKKGSKLNSILTGSCPKCQEESMYVEKNPYKLGSIFEMHPTCSHCGTRYKMEPSFFYGAMYVSYGVSIAIGVAAFIVANVFIGLGLLNSFIAIVATLILTYPMVLRVSRNIWINMFVHYEKDWKDKKTNAN